MLERGRQYGHAFYRAPRCRKTACVGDKTPGYRQSTLPPLLNFNNLPPITQLYAPYGQFLS